MGLYKQFINLIKFQSKNSLPQTQATFKALVDAIIPKTPELADKEGSIQLFGALDLHTEEYQVWSMDQQISLKIIIKNFNIHMANAIAEMLNIAAKELIYKGGNSKPISSNTAHDAGMFSALAPNDRFRAIALLEQLQVDLASLPIPFHNNPGFVLSVTSIITLLTTIGYYSEWPGYGSTRLESPEKRKIEDFPIGWKQAGYPGPSKGYHALRGYLIDKFTE